MRVAIVTESFLPTINGVTNSVARVLDCLATAGHEAIVLCPAAGAPATYAGFEVTEVAAVAYRRFPVGLPSGRVTRSLQRFRPDVLHAASPFLLGSHAIKAANRLGIPSVAIYQTDVAGYARRNRLGATAGFAWEAVRRIHAGADRTLAPSTTAIADLHAAGIPRVQRWGRGVDIERFHPRERFGTRAAELRRLIDPSGTRTVVGYVGRLAPEKSVDRLTALAGMDDIALAIIGDGPDLARLRKKLRHLPVTFLGARGGDDLAAAYGALDVFVHTGTEETFGQTVQEAHASGLPVVAPRAGGPIDLVSPSHDGYLFDPDRPADLRASVGRLVADPILRARMGEAGRRRVLGTTWEATTDELLGHYRAVIEARAAASVATPTA